MTQTLAEKLNAEFEEWFERLKKLAPDNLLNPDDWTGRWYDGFTPEQALAEGPEDD